jgi:hypothetical protein
VQVKADRQRLVAVTTSLGLAAPVACPRVALVAGLPSALQCESLLAFHLAWSKTSKTEVPQLVRQPMTHASTIDARWWTEYLAAYTLPVLRRLDTTFGPLVPNAVPGADDVHGNLQGLVRSRTPFLDELRECNICGKGRADQCAYHRNRLIRIQQFEHAGHQAVTQRLRLLDSVAA